MSRRSRLGSARRAQLEPAADGTTAEPTSQAPSTSAASDRRGRPAIADLACDGWPTGASPCPRRPRVDGLVAAGYPAAACASLPHPPPTASRRPRRVRIRSGVLAADPDHRRDGTLGKALARACELARPRLCANRSRDACRWTTPTRSGPCSRDIDPWLVINAAGFVRVDDAEREADACMAANAARRDRGVSRRPAPTAIAAVRNLFQRPGVRRRSLSPLCRERRHPSA